MASFNKKVKNVFGSQEMNKFNLSSSNITSSDFFQLKVVYNREMVPGSSISVGCDQFSRLAPLVKPYYGQVQIINRAFFVPYRTVWQPWNSFITQTSNDSYYNINPSEAPYATNADFIEAFLNEQVVVLVDLVQSAVDNPYFINEGVLAFDFAIKRSSDNLWNTYRFTRSGQRFYDILLNLGYKLDFPGYSSSVEGRNVKMNLLPLYSYLKICFDWYRNTQFMIEDPIPTPTNNSHILSEEIMLMAQYLLHAPYELDYFTSSWKNPSGPSTNIPSITIPDVSMTSVASNLKSEISNALPSGVNGTPNVHGDSGTTSTVSVKAFTQYLDSALHHATDFVKRYQLFGSRTADIMKSVFGVDLSDVALNRSVHIGKSVDYINVADVMQTTPTELDGEQQPLGDYAGKGIGAVHGRFKYKTDEFGQFIIISVIVPRIMYNQGRDRFLSHISPLQFFTPDFDKLGVQAIRNDELFVPGEYGAFESYNPNSIFGFTSRYAEYKTVANDRRTGLFALRSLNGDNRWNCYHFTRYVHDYYVNQPYINNSRGFVEGESQQYDRIFADQNENSDHFITVYNFSVEMWQPMSKLFDDYEWSDCDGKGTVLNIGGTQIV